MQKISEITRRDILDLFRNGLDINELFLPETVAYNYYGCIKEIDFLEKTYDLEKMPSADPNFDNAKQEILHHTEVINDYQRCWVFEDDRFKLKDGSDEFYLEFLCKVFHPAIRFEKGFWKKFLSEINKLLQIDGYELYSAEKISNRDVYKWRLYQQGTNSIFIPYSQRNAKSFEAKSKTLKISMKARTQIYYLLSQHNIDYYATDETGWNYNTDIVNDMFNDMKLFYTPKCYSENNEYVETNNLKPFILRNAPYYVLDAIEFFAQHDCINDDFEQNINTIFKLNDLPFSLSGGIIVCTSDIRIDQKLLDSVREPGLKELIQEASNYYNENNMSIAVEKLWDAFERLKTFYCSPTIKKKQSADRVVNDMSNGQQPFYEMFAKEFAELTTIGNEFRIRHHETTKTDIMDQRHYDYLYMRCLSLIKTAMKFFDFSE